MAATTIYWSPKDAPRPDGLCPHCNNPSLRVYYYKRIDMNGVTDIGERVACSDERIWIAPLKEYPRERA